MPTRRGTTSNRFIYNEQRQFPEATGEFSEILTQIILAAKVVSREVNRAGIAGILGAVGETNVQGEQVQKLDVFANRHFLDALSDNCHVSVIASEENEELIHTDHDNKHRPGKYAVAIDPLDGSSNIDVNVSIGTIFSIHRRITDGQDGGADDVLQEGTRQLAAGYVLYGSSTMLVFSVGRGVHGFTLDPSVGEFLLSHPNIQMPKQGSIYSINEGNFPYWAPEVREWVVSLKGAHNPAGKPNSLRYIGSLVADFHRTLFKGGIFAYPLDYKDPKNPRGKLRMLYEAAPIAMIAENAGGLAIDGQRRILDIKPKSLHERTPLFVGSEVDVNFARSFQDR
ncbi:MAG: fructose-1,6-bisphosphatase class 1 [Gemmatimonadota bacterium]|nr:MAG: fructose-1,6-bisphosphatase class 1 [Gemmatimonadota bacterium]